MQDLFAHWNRDLRRWSVTPSAHKARYPRLRAPPKTLPEGVSMANRHFT